MSAPDFAPYIWGAYAAAVIILGGVTVVTTLRWQAARRALAALERTSKEHAR